MGLILSPLLRWLWPLAGVVVVLVATWLHGYGTAQKHGLQDALVKVNQARTSELQMSRDTFRLREVKDAEIDAINRRLVSALERLRTRPERLPEPARAACAGATGAELSGRDAAILEGLAARADRLRTALGECQGWIDQVSAR